MNNYKVLSGSALKVIAIISMLLDHTAIALASYLPALQPYYYPFRVVGRLAFPIFCFLLVEGFLHTSDRMKYLRNLLIFALISEIPFDFLVCIGASIWSYQNVFFTLFFGLLAMWGLEHFRGKFLIETVIFGSCLLLAWLLKTDYDWKGVLLIAVFYLCRRDMFTMSVAGAAALTWEWPAIFAFIPINLYNGKRGWMKGPALKYAFYAFYPAHMIILSTLRYCFATTQLPLL